MPRRLRRLCCRLARVLVSSVALPTVLAAPVSLLTPVARAQDTGPAAASQPAGPGQAVARPAPGCPQTAGCTYDERNDAPTGYRFQALTVCGADCTTQYWVGDLATDAPLLGAGPVPGGGLLTVWRGDVPAGGRAAVRTVLPQVGPDDPACCPAGYADITYAWDGAAGALRPEPVRTIAAADFGSWDAQRARLEGDGFAAVLGGVAGGAGQAPGDPAPPAAPARTVTDPTYGFRLTLPASGPVLGPPGAGGAPATGPCGTAVRATDLAGSDMRGVLVDNLLFVQVVDWPGSSGSIRDYFAATEPRPADVDRLYDLRPVPASGAAESVLPVRRPGGDPGPAPVPLGSVLAAYKQGDRLFVLRPLQNPSAPGACVAAGPDELRRIAASFVAPDASPPAGAAPGAAVTGEGERA